MCNAGDTVAADKGFNIQDLFEEALRVVNIPVFFQKKIRL